MGADDTGVEQGGGGCTDLVPDILGGGLVCPVVHVRDVGDEPLHWRGVGRIPPQSGLKA